MLYLLDGGLKTGISDFPQKTKSLHAGITIEWHESLSLSSGDHLILWDRFCCEDDNNNKKRSLILSVAVSIKSEIYVSN